MRLGRCHEGVVGERCRGHIFERRAHGLVDRDFLGAAAARVLAAAQVFQGGGQAGLIPSTAGNGLQNVARFHQGLARVNKHRAARKAGIVALTHRRRKAANQIQVRTRLQPLTANQGRGGQGGAADDVRRACRLLQIGRQFYH